MSDPESTASAPYVIPDTFSGPLVALLVHVYAQERQ